MFSLNPNLHGKNALIIRPYRKHRTHHCYGVFVFLRHPVVCIPVHDVVRATNRPKLINSGGLPPEFFRTDGRFTKTCLSSNCVEPQPNFCAFEKLFHNTKNCIIFTAELVLTIPCPIAEKPLVIVDFRSPTNSRI